MKGLRKGYGCAARMGCLTLSAILCACFLGCGLSPAPQVVVTPVPMVAASHAPRMTPSPVASAFTTAPAENSTPAPTASPVSKPTQIPSQTKMPVQSQMPPQFETPKALPEAERPLFGLVIGLDPGHQKHPDKKLEPIAPGSSVMKKKVSSGTRGVATGIYEYRVNLTVGLFLKDMLEEAGAAVVMTHIKADVNISNIERAELFNKNMVDLGIRLHCDGNTDQSMRGAFMLVPENIDHPYYDDCILAAKAILTAYGSETGLDVSKGITYRSDQTGFNWCTRPITNIEMGYMTNPEEDRLLTDADFQLRMAQGIFNGIVAYFTAKSG